MAHCPRSIPAIPHSSIGIRRAHATLRHAARFLGGHADRPARSGCHSKVIGNGLRELDRFLSVLIDEVAATTDIETDALATLRTRRNTANKWRMLHDALGSTTPHHPRLRALGRSRDCLFYCDGLVRRADRRKGTRMTAGWSPRAETADASRGDALGSWPLGSRLTVDDAEIGDVCRFYDSIADELLAASCAPHCAIRPASLPFRADARI